MSGVWRGLLALVLAVTLLAGGVATVAAADAGSGAIQAEGAIEVDQRFSLTPNDPGNVSVELEYAIPDSVRSLRTTTPDNATVTNAVGFERRNGSAYEWDGDEEGPTLTYRYHVNRTDHRTGPKGAHGSYLAADAGEWALFTRPNVPTDYEYVGDEPDFERQSVIDGEGAAGEWLVYLGPQQTFTRSSDNQTIQLVVPRAATMEDSPREVLSGLTQAADSFTVGDSDDEVFVVAAPTGQVPWAVRGLQTGDAEMWVKDDERLTDPENVWSHEYVHTRQDFETTPDARWLEEAIAAYYATLLTFEHQPMGFEGFADQLARGAGEDYASVVLGSPESWRGFADYYKGGLTIAHLDRQIRTETDGNRTFADVVASLNDRDRVDASTFAEAVERTGGDDVRADANRLVGSPTNTTMWNRSEHRDAFGPLPARIEYDLPEGDDVPTYHVSGRYRDTAIPTDSPLMLATGETLRVRAHTTNTGGSEGMYEAALQLNGTTVTTATGTVAPNETRIVPLEHTFVVPGRYELNVDGSSVPVVVREPVTARVADAYVDPATVDQGETASLVVSVDNTAAGPAERELIVTRNFREVARETVYLGAEATTTVTIDVPFPSPGNARVEVNGNYPSEVTVNPAPVATDTQTPNGTAVPTPDGSPTPTTEGTGAGFGVATVAVAIALLTLVRRRRC